MKVRIDMRRFGKGESVKEDDTGTLIISELAETYAGNESGLDTLIGDIEDQMHQADYGRHFAVDGEMYIDEYNDNAKGVSIVIDVHSNQYEFELNASDDGTIRIPNGTLRSM